MFDEEAIERIENLGGTAVAVYYSLEGVHAYTKCKYETFEAMKKIVIDKELPEHRSLLQELNGLPIPRPEIVVDDDPVDMFKPEVVPTHGAGILDPRDPSRIVAEKQSLARVLNSANDDFYILKLKSMLPKFEAPSDKNMLKFFLSDKNRGYLSYLMLKMIGKREFESYVAELPNGDSLAKIYHQLPILEDFQPLEKLFVRFGLNYWLSRGHILSTSSKEIFDYVMAITPGQKQQTDFEKTLETQYLRHKYYQEVSKLLEQKGLKYYKEEFKTYVEAKRKSRHRVKFLPMKPVETLAAKELTKQV
jgi:hypothetical protein